MYGRVTLSCAVFGMLVLALGCGGSDDGGGGDGETGMESGDGDGDGDGGACGEPLCTAPASSGPVDALDLIGKWNGTVESGSFNLKTPISFELTNDGFEVDSGPFCPSGMDPEPALITLEDGTLNGSTWMMNSGILGDVVVTFDFDTGTFVGSGNPFVYQVSFNGTLQPESIALAWEVSIQNLVVDAGTGAFTKEGSDAELCGLPVPSSAPVVPDCDAVVPETAGVGGDCGAECMPPNGACIDGACRQVCVPFQCDSLCADTDLCQAVAGQTFGDGSQLGACVPEPQGTQGPYEMCGGASGDCQPGHHCFGFLGDTFNVCNPKCEVGDSCPTIDGAPSTCGDIVNGATGQLYCTISCDYAGDATCPAGFECLPSITGGTCKRI